MLQEHAPGFPEGKTRVVDVRRFCTGTVQLHDMDVLTSVQVGHTAAAQVVAALVKPVDGYTDAVKDAGLLRGNQVSLS